MNAPEKKRRRWPFAFLVLLPCCGFCGWNGKRMTSANHEREALANGALAAVEAFKADAGSYPERLEAVLPREEDRRTLRYETCPKSGGFQLSYDEASVGMLPSDFARVWNAKDRSWDPHELSQLPPCE